MYGCLIVLMFLSYSCPIDLVYTISAQNAKLTTLPIGFNIKLPTKWYIATLIPGVG